MTPEQFGALRRRITNRLVQLLQLAFGDLGAWRDPDTARFAAQAQPQVTGAQQTLALLTAAFIAQQATAALGRTVAPPVIPADVLQYLRRDTTFEDAYKRPFVTMRAELARATAAGERPDVARAIELGSRRLAQVAEMDLQQTFAESARAAMEKLPPADRPTGWRRVLVGDVNCAMCVVASTQLYRIDELNPIHPACDCTVAPHYGPDEHVIEPDLLERVHAAVKELTGQTDRGARAPDYRELLTRMTPEHGELGRMLVNPRHRSRAKYELPA